LQDFFSEIFREVKKAAIRPSGTQECDRILSVTGSSTFSPDISQAVSGPEMSVGRLQTRATQEKQEQSRPVKSLLPHTKPIAA